MSKYGFQRWESLLFLHWPVAQAALRNIVPPELTIDEFDGRAFVGIVAFVMRDIRPRGWPKAWAFNFLETNVRTYVTFRGQPGVYFFSLDASSLPAVWGARLIWGLPYFAAKMDLRCDASGRRSYTSRRNRDGAFLSVEYTPGELVGPAPPGTVDHFLLERYVLYVKRFGRLYAGRVQHPAYPAQQAAVSHVSESLIAAAGLPAPQTAPEFAHFVAAVDVDIVGLQPTTRDSNSECV